MIVVVMITHITPRQAAELLRLEEERGELQVCACRWGIKWGGVLLGFGVVYGGGEVCGFGCIGGVCGEFVLE